MRGFFNYFKDIQFKDGRIHVATTGAQIKPDKAFFRGAFAMVKIYLYFKARDVKHFMLRTPDKAAIAFYPQTPGPWFNIWQVMKLAHLRREDDLVKADYIFLFEDTTQSDPAKDIPYELQAQRLNHAITDISKTHVAKVFEDVFGYGLSVDPLTYNGKAICKSDANGTHDGVVVACPISRQALKKAYVYQRLVDSTFTGKTSEDLRVAFALGEIALVYHKHKPLDDRFGTHYLSVDVMAAEDVFSPAEINLIIKFCDAMGLDFGAIDVMRDKHDGRIYIVDVNKTCMPVLSLTLAEQIKSQQKIADSLLRGLANIN